MLTPSSTFNQAQAFVLKWEGGLCEDKNDAGGITNYGVCLRFLKSIKPDASREDIINLTKEEASKIFYENFWQQCRCDELPDKIAFALYDTAVNVGCRQAVKFLQRCLDYVKVDGIVGQETIGDVYALLDAGLSETELVEMFLAQREQFYKNLAKKKPSQQVFLKGWLNRTHALASAVNEMTANSSTA